MQRALALFLACAAVLSGCVGKDPPATSSTPTTPTPEGARADDASPAPAGTAASATDDLAATAPSVETIPLLLDGNIGSSATVCAFGPVGQCRSVDAQEGDRAVILDGLAGWIDGGEVVLTWDASSPATEELAAGFMLMDGGDGCESVQLGGAHGPSPLTIAIEPASRPLCSGEVVHLWVSGNTYGFHDPAYYQADVDQEFHAEGAFLLRADADADAMG